MVKVAILGAGGGVGQGLSLQLRLSPFVDELALYDRGTAAGVAVNLSHIPVKQIIKGYKAIENGLQNALTVADIVIVTPGPFSSLPPDFVWTTRNDFLHFSADTVGSMIECCAKICPKAVIIIVSNPVNALVPFAAKILKKHNAFDARRLLGVTTLDVVRAETFLAEMLGTMSEHGAGVEVNVIGGHSDKTMVPLFSHVDLAEKLSSEQLDTLVRLTQYAGAEVYFVKDKKAGATLSAAYAILRMAERACRALKGDTGMRECSFVYLPGIEGGNKIAELVGVDFFSVPLELGVDGAARISNSLRKLSENENRLVLEGTKYLRDDIKLGSELGKAFGTVRQGSRL